MPALDQLIGVLQIEIAALRLEVWPVWATLYWPFIDLQTKPSEALDDRFDGPWHSACCVGIFDAQQELAASVARQEPAKERRAIAADVL
jgi:hypothetical protein